VYQRLRQEIVRGELRPRESLSEVEIAERLAVSRTPVRESMHRLASEGLITSRRRRWVVYEHSKDEIREIYEVRAALEGYSARLASQRATDAELTVARLYTPADLEHSGRQHRQLLDAIVVRDAARAEAVARDHIEYALELILRRL
jgi:DNA-binding GntR family transcriptional regulator